MRILWVKADKLLPVQNGGNIRTFHVLRYLSARHELTFYSYYPGTPDPDYERELQRQLPGYVAVCDFLDAAVNFPGSLNIPSVLFQHNVESEIWRRHAATADNPAKKMMY